VYTWSVRDPLTKMLFKIFSGNFKLGKEAFGYVELDRVIARCGLSIGVI